VTLRDDINTATSTEEIKMRMLVLAAAVLASAPASAQSWKEYAYPSYSFSVSFPAEPKIETTTYQAADGRSVQARVYSVAQDGAVFKMTIVELADPAADESAVLDHAVKTLAGSGEIKVDIPARINRVFGRQLSIVGQDGSHSTAAVFYHKGRLYQIEGDISATGSDAQAIRFQQSLVFTGGESNRSSDADGQGRRRCRGGPDNAGIPGSVAAADGQSRLDLRCRRDAR
jgi:hypothetical protein